MNPFLEEWPRLERHDARGCYALANDYFGQSNVFLPNYDDAWGCMVVVAGKKGIGGKSVISHKMLHQYQDMPASVSPVDLSRPLRGRTDDNMFWLRRAVITAYRTANLIRPRQAAEILEVDDWEFMTVAFQRALKENSCAVAIRIPLIDAYLTVDAAASDISDYADSARLLDSGFYIYEYPYRENGDLELLLGKLRSAGVGNLRLIKAPSLLADDAAEFVDRCLSRCSRPLASGVRDDVKKVLERLALAGPGGLEVDIGRFSSILCRAFEKAEDDGHDGHLASYIEAEYQAERACSAGSGGSGHD
jgi:hypothetical protein